MAQGKSKTEPKSVRRRGRCSTSHLLVDLVDEITTILEDRRAAAVLTGVDYSKAFNRLAHGPCLLSFATKGASTQMIKLLASFLMKRRMRVRVGKVWSKDRFVNSGAPQGSVLGSFLFNVGIDSIEAACGYPEKQFQDTMEAHPPTRDYPAFSTPSRVTKTREDVMPSPIRVNDRTEQEIRVLPVAKNTPPWLRKPKEQTWQDRTPKDLKYIDDGVNATKINMKKVALYEENGKDIKIAHPMKAQAILHHITREAGKRGMKVNGGKTSLLCVSGATSYVAAAEIRDTEGNRIRSSEHANYLGVTIDADCTFKTHVDNIKRKIRARSWALNSLRQNGFSEEELVKIYCVYVRPLAEYASVVWGTMITGEQAEKLEKQQTQSLKNIYGLGISARKMRSRARVPLLKERREEALNKFANKCQKNPRFTHWFPECIQSGRVRRSVAGSRTYEIPIIRTDRHWNSPKNAMRRCLNEQKA